MRIAVLGGGGFLGSHVADALSEAGHNVVVFDCKPSAYLKPEQSMVVGDILDAAALGDTIEGCEVVYNFAGVADLDEANASPRDSAMVNIVGNINACDTCVLHGVKRYVFASTLYVYSRVGGAYRCSKQACEAYIDHYEQTKGLQYTILRYGSLYGPRSGITNGIHRFVHEALTTGHIRYVGSPEAVRDYIHVRDAALASVEILKPEFAGQHIILSGSQTIQITQLFRMIAEIAGKPVTIDYQTDHASPHYVTTPYSFTPRTGLKYSPVFHHDLGQGLLMVIQELSGDVSLLEKGETGNEGLNPPLGNGRP